MGGWQSVRNSGVAIRRAALFLGVGAFLLIATLDAVRLSDRAWWVFLLLAIPCVLTGLRMTMMGAWVHEASRRLRLVTFFRIHRYDFDDVLDVRTDHVRGAGNPVVVHRDGGKVRIPMLERSAFLPDILITRDEDYEPYLRRLRILIGHWGVRAD